MTTGWRATLFSLRWSCALFPVLVFSPHPKEEGKKEMRTPALENALSLSSLRIQGFFFLTEVDCPFLLRDLSTLTRRRAERRHFLLSPVGQNDKEPRLQYWVTRSSVHLSLRSSVCLHRLLVCLLRPTHFARALCCSLLLDCSLTSCTPSLVGH